MGEEARRYGHGLMLTFDEARHVYFWHGKPVPNVTRVIGHLTNYSMIDPEKLRIAQDEGRAVHKMVELDCKGDLDVARLYSDDRQAWMRPRYEAWQRFIEDTGFVCIQAEQKMFDDVLGFAGTPDLICELPKLERRLMTRGKVATNGVWNIDIKRSLYAGPAIGLQTGGYTELYNRKATRDRRVTRRGALILKDSRDYRLTEYDDPEDRVAFLACLQQYRWKEKHYGST